MKILLCQLCLIKLNEVNKFGVSFFHFITHDLKNLFVKQRNSWKICEKFLLTFELVEQWAKQKLVLQEPTMVFRNSILKSNFQN